MINIAEGKIKRVYSSAFARSVLPPKVLKRLINSLIPYCEVNFCMHCTDCTYFLSSNKNKLSKLIISQ